MEEVKIDVKVLDTLSKSIDKRLAQVSSTQTLHGGKINKVPWPLRDVNAKSYEPEMVAIGPYHHGKGNLKAMEELKSHYFHKLVQRKPDQKMNYLSEIAEIEKDARAFYSEHIGLDEAKFIEMLVLDGCFIIELIGGFKGNEHTTNIPTRLSNSLHRDLVLLENQIPFFVLCKLFDLIEGQNQYEELMERVFVFFKDVFPGKILYKRCRRADEVKHILDLVHSNWYPPLSNNTGEQASLSSFFIPSAVKLKYANVKFKLKKYARVSEHEFRENKGTTLFDVEFDDGVVLMPALVIDDETESLLRNLIAYEQYFSETERTPVTDYALLLDSLIDNAEDVQILCRSGIIENLLGSDEAVAEFVNQLTYKILYFSDNFMYGKIFNDINGYINHKKYWKRPVAVLWSRALVQFKSPWTFISVVAAAVLLLLPVAQTVIAALQFQHPPN